jgi:hypothetical protein
LDECTDWLLEREASANNYWVDEGVTAGRYSRCEIESNHRDRGLWVEGRTKVSLSHAIMAITMVAAIMVSAIAALSGSKMTGRIPSGHPGIVGGIALVVVSFAMMSSGTMIMKSGVIAVARALGDDSTSEAHRRGGAMMPWTMIAP